MAIDEADYDSVSFHELWAHLGVWLGAQGNDSPLRGSQDTVPLILSTATPCFDYRPDPQWWTGRPTRLSQGRALVIRIKTTHEHQVYSCTSLEFHHAFATRGTEVLKETGFEVDRLVTTHMGPLLNALAQVQNEPFHAHPTPPMIEAATPLWKKMELCRKYQRCALRYWRQYGGQWWECASFLRGWQLGLKGSMCCVKRSATTTAPVVLSTCLASITEWCMTKL